MLTIGGEIAAPKVEERARWLLDSPVTQGEIGGHLVSVSAARRLITVRYAQSET